MTRESRDHGPDRAGTDHRRAGRLHPRPPPPDQRDVYETALRAAAQQAADSGDVTAFSEVVEQWWAAALLEHHGGEGWQRQKRLIEEGRWEELLANSEPVDVDAMLRESRP